MNHYLVVASLMKKFSIDWRVRKNKNKLKLLNMEKTKDPIEIIKYRSIILEVRRVNNQPYDADGSQKTR
jgi:rRNA processing protein Krr1/Pno1